jgi:hypothetical protein
MAETLGLVCAVILPVFNIPLILRMVRRKSSADISLIWAGGVWLCFLGMLPSCLRSQDATYKIFGIVNIVFFSAVFGCVLWYHPALRRPR